MGVLVGGRAVRGDMRLRERMGKRICGGQCSSYGDGGSGV